ESGSRWPGVLHTHRVLFPHSGSSRSSVYHSITRASRGVTGGKLRWSGARTHPHARNNFADSPKDFLSSTSAHSNALIRAARSPIERTRRATALTPSRAPDWGPAALLTPPGPAH